MSADIERVAVTVVALGFPLIVKRPRPAILDPVVRAAVLVDLALSGALTDVGGSVEVDTSPTGFAPADRLLQAVVADPSRSVGWWLTHAPLTVRDIADELIAAKRWERRGPTRRVRELDPKTRTTELEWVDAAVRDRRAAPAVAATAALLDLLPLPRRSPVFSDEDCLMLCGSAAWILPDLLDNLARRQAMFQAAGRDAQTAQSATFIV